MIGNPGIVRINLRFLVKILILLIFVLGNFFNLNAGWADNGDFYRVATWFSTGPIINETWPVTGTEAWYRRFYSYYIPEWNLDMTNKSEMFSSAVLLWYPGVFLNRYFYSASTLYLPIMSLGARVLLFIFLLLVFDWIDRRSSHPLFNYFTIGLPLALLFSTTDITAFFNSFYQENAVIIFVPYLVAVILMGRRMERGWSYYLLYVLVLFLVVTSKSASIFWPALALPFVIPFVQVFRHPLKIIGLVAVLVILPTLLGLILTEVPNTTYIRPYNGLFTGTLMLSENPQQRLIELSIPDLYYCIGSDFYSTKEGHDCAYKHPGKITYLAIMKTMLHEPKIIVKQVYYVIYSIQNYSLHLGKYIYGDNVLRQERWLNFWSILKLYTFPKGWLFLGIMPILLALIGLAWKSKDITGDLAVSALVFLCAFWIDSLIEIWVDGQRDLLKHLAMPNMFFDYAWIASLNIIVLLAIGWVRENRKVIAIPKFKGIPKLHG